MKAKAIYSDSASAFRSLDGLFQFAAFRLPPSGLPVIAAHFRSLGILLGGYMGPTGAQTDGAYVYDRAAGVAGHTPERNSSCASCVALRLPAGDWRHFYWLIREPVMPDAPLAAMSCAAAAYGADYLRKKTSSSLSLWLLFTAFAMLIKKEGTLIGVIMIIAMSITLIFARKSRDLPRILLKVICIISVIARSSGFYFCWFIKNSGRRFCAA